MANGNYGMQTAAKKLIRKDLGSFAPSIGTPWWDAQAPNQYDPYSHPEAAQQRRNLVLKEMPDMKTSFLTNNTKQRSIHLLQMVWAVSVLLKQLPSLYG